MVAVDTFLKHHALACENVPHPSVSTADVHRQKSAAIAVLTASSYRSADSTWAGLGCSSLASSYRVGVTHLETGYARPRSCSRLEVAMQDKRIKVSAVGPDDGTELRIDAHFAEEVRVSKWLEDGSVQLPGKINLARAGIAEAKPQPVMAKHLYRSDIHILHRSSLAQRVDRVWGPSLLCQSPVGPQLVAVHTGPFAYQLVSAGGQATYKYTAVRDADGGVVLGVAHVEMGRLVIIEVHRDHDPVKETDTRTPARLWRVHATNSHGPFIYEQQAYLRDSPGQSVWLRVICSVLCLDH